MDRLIHSAKFWTAVLDAVCSSVLLLVTRFLSPTDVDLIKQLILIYQPVILAVIAAIAIEDASQKSALARAQAVPKQ